MKNNKTNFNLDVSKLSGEVTRTLEPQHASKTYLNPGDTLPDFTLWNIMPQGGKWDDEKCLPKKNQQEGNNHEIRT